MAKVTNSFTSYDATADREDLSNVIYNIDPTATPFMSAIGTKNVSNVVFDWQTENLPTPSGTGKLEGFELSRSASQATVRESNVAMISSRDATVSGSQDASNAAGKKQELAHQMALMSKALKRDMEVALCQNTAKAAGNNTTARQTRSFESWITTNASRGSSGSNGSASAAATDGTQRNFTETLLKGLLQTMYGNGAEPKLCIVGPVNKGKMSDFTGRANTRQTVSADTVSASVSVYSGDFGEISIIPSNRSRERTALLVDPEYAKVSYLRGFQTMDIAKIGDADTKLILAEYGLEVSNEAAHGVVADLTTS